MRVDVLVLSGDLKCFKKGRDWANITWPRVGQSERGLHHLKLIHTLTLFLKRNAHSLECPFLLNLYFIQRQICSLGSLPLARPWCWCSLGPAIARGDEKFRHPYPHVASFEITFKEISSGLLCVLRILTHFIFDGIVWTVLCSPRACISLWKAGKRSYFYCVNPYNHLTWSKSRVSSVWPQPDF